MLHNRPYAYDVIKSWRPPLGVNMITRKCSCQKCARSRSQVCTKHGLYPQHGNVMTSMHKVYTFKDSELISLGKTASLWLMIYYKVSLEARTNIQQIHINSDRPYAMTSSCRHVGGKSHCFVHACDLRLAHF